MSIKESAKNLLKSSTFQWACLIVVIFLLSFLAAEADMIGYFKDMNKPAPAAGERLVGYRQGPNFWTIGNELSAYQRGN